MPVLVQSSSLIFLFLASNYLQRMHELAGMEDGAQDRRQEGEGRSGNVVTLKRYSDFSLWTFGMVCAIVGQYYPVREDITEHAITPYFFVFRSLLCSTFLADSLLMVLVLSVWLGRISERHYMIAAKILIHTTAVLMMLTSTSLLLLLNRSYAMVTILVLPVIAIVVIACYNGINNSRGQAREVTDYNYEDHRSELKQLFDLSASVTSGAFVGMLTTIFAYFKNFPKVVDQEVDVKFSEAFIFFTVIFGLLAMLLTTVPPSVAHPSRYITFIKVLSYSLFGLLALIGLAVAAQCLGQIIFLAFLPIFLAVVVWFRKEFISQEDGTSRDQGATGHESEPDASSITITAFIFAALMAVYSVNFGSEGDADFHQKTCMFFMSMAFMSSMGWMILAMAFRPPRTPALAMAVMILACSTIFWFAVAMPYLLFLAIRSGN